MSSLLSFWARMIRLILSFADPGRQRIVLQVDMREFAIQTVKPSRRSVSTCPFPTPSATAHPGSPWCRAVAKPAAGRQFCDLGKIPIDRTLTGP